MMPPGNNADNCVRTLAARRGATQDAAGTKSQDPRMTCQAGPNVVVLVAAFTGWH